MNGITESPISTTGYSSSNNNLPEEQYSASLVQKQSVKTSESLTAGLTIKTKEGDIVTLNSNSFSKAESFLYSRQGVVKTEDGVLLTSSSYKEIRLKSGESFSFTVQGDLNEEELEDIAHIIKDIDSIIEEMAQGDMKDAVSKALSMGGYESVSAYSADLTYSRSYEMAAYTRAEQSYESKPAIGELSQAQMVSKGRHNHKKASKPDKSQDFMERMAKKLEQREAKLLEKALEPIDKLFNHHLNEFKKEDQPSSTYQSIKDARKNLHEMITDMVNKAFKDTFDKFF